MYKYYLTTSKVLSKNAAIFFEGTTDKDNQLLYDIKNSRTLNNLEIFSSFNNELYKAYELVE